VQIARETGAKEVKPVAPGKTKLVMSLAKFESEEAAQAAEKQLKKNPKVVLVAKNKLLRIPPVIKEQTSFAPSAATKDPAPTLPVVARARPSALSSSETRVFM
jgi:hypothetical protein